MRTKKLYLEDARLLRTAAVIQDLGVMDDRPWVRLDQTVFHAQGGGQKADRGTISGVAVTSVAHAADGEVDHFVESIKSFTHGQRVELSVDEAWRRSNARYHSGGHLIAAVIEARFPSLRAVSGHHWPGEARVEFEGDPKPSVDAIADALSGDLVEAISDGAPVKVVGEPHSDRSVKIGEYTAVPCGGTHVEHLAELDGIQIDKVRIKSGKVRVSYSFPG